MAKIFFYDLETTGTMFWKHGIHQIAGIIDIDGKIVEEFNFKIRPNPNAKIDTEALKVSGVSQFEIENYLFSMEEGYQQIVKMLAKYADKYDKNDKFFLCGFRNSAFDDPFFKAFFTQNNDNYFFSWFWSNSLDVSVLATEYFKNFRETMKDFKLSTVSESLGIKVEQDQLHDALYDVKITRECYFKLIQNGFKTT